MVVLRGQPRNHHRASIKLTRQIRVAQESLQCEPRPLNPVLCRQINCREGSEPAIGRTARHKVILRLSNRAGIFPDFTCKEFVKSVVRIWIRNLHFLHAVLKVEALNEGSDMCLALGIVVLLAHFLALAFEQIARAFPVKGFLFRRAVVEQVHPDADIDAHGFEGFIAGLTVNHVVAHMKLGLEFVDGLGRQQFGEELVRVWLVGWLMKGGLWIGTVVRDSVVRDSLKRIGRGLEAFFTEVFRHGEVGGCQLALGSLLWVSWM